MDLKLLIAAGLGTALCAVAHAQNDAQWSQRVVRQAEQALAQKQFVTGPIDGKLDAWSRFGLDSFQRYMDLAATGELNLVGPVDGVIDASTRYGLRQFQRDYDLAATGDLNAQTLQALDVEIDR